MRAYLKYVEDIMEELYQEEKAIEKAAVLVTQSLMDGGRFYVFGTGHSHMIAEELYVRAGGLALVKAILPPEIMLHEMPTKSTVIERLEGYAEPILDLHNTNAKDSLMVISNSGRNNVPVEMCLMAKERGMSVIAMTSKRHSSGTTSHHRSGLMIGDIADVTIDNHAPKGDAGFHIEGIETPVGPVSTITGATLAQALIVVILEKLQELDFKAPIFLSSNLDGADEYNKILFNKYYGYWK